MKRCILAAGLAALTLAIPVAAQEPQRPKPRPASLLASTLEGPVDQMIPALAPDPAAVEEALRQAALPDGDQNKTTTAKPPVQDPNRGAVTNLPLPRYVSLKSGEGNARRGPGLTHRIDWVFTRAGMPLRLTAEHGHWRRVEDADGLGGWVHYALLSGVRSVLVTEEMTKFYSRADPSSSVVFQAEADVVAKVVECHDNWCRVSIDRERGWAPVSAFWGVDKGEILE